MAKFPIISGPQELGGIPATAVRAREGIRTDTAAGLTGEAVGQALLDVLKQVGVTKKEESGRRKAIELKRRQMMDDNMSVIAKQMRDTATITFNTFKLTNPQETWEPERIKQTQEIADGIAELDFSPDALLTENLKSSAYSSVESAKAFSDATRQLVKDTVEAQTQAMVDAFRTGGAREQLDAITRYRDNGTNMGKDKVEVLNDIKAARVAGQKLRKQDVIDEWQDKVAENPVAVENVLSIELEARKEDKGTIPENLLASADIQSLINLANAREVQLLADTLAERNRQQRDLENELYDGLADKSQSIPDVMGSNLDASAKRRLVNDEEDFAQRDVNKTWPFIDDGITVERLDSQLSSLEAGTIDRTQMDQQVNAAAVDGKLTKESRDKFRTLSKKGGRDAIDSAVKLGTDTIKNALLSRLDDREARFLVRTLAGTLTPQEQREAGNNAFLQQVNRHQLLLIEGEIDRTMRLTGKDTISGIEATTITSAIWEKFRQKTLGEKINDFKEFSGQRIPRPGNFPEERWNQATDREKTAIVEAIDKGLSSSEILRILKQ